METKRCADCEQEKPLERFNQFNPWYCRDCLNRRAREWRQRKRREYLAENPPVVPTSKQCRMCNEHKSLTEFNFANKRKGIRSSYCKPCGVQRAHTDRTRRGRGDEQLRYKCKRMGTTPEWFLAKLVEQNYLCAICHQPEDHPVKRGGNIRNLAIDHNHSTGKVRGLLCCKCNQSLHRLEKFPGWAESAVVYLAKYKET